MTYDEHTQMREAEQEMKQYLWGTIACLCVAVILGVLQTITTEFVLSVTLLVVAGVVAGIQSLLLFLAIKKALFLRRVKSRA